MAQDSKVVVLSKTCTRCKDVFPVLDFNKRTGNKDGKMDVCKHCMAKYRQAYYRHSEEYRKKRIQQATKQNRKRKYGISPEEFDNLLKSQNYSCAICSVHLDGSRFSLKGQLDHCHKTKKVRGILCGQCNTSLGNFKEDEDILLSAIQYLRKHKNG